VNAQHLPAVYLTTLSVVPAKRNPTIHDSLIISREGRAGERLWPSLSYLIGVLAKELKKAIKIIKPSIIIADF